MSFSIKKMAVATTLALLSIGASAAVADALGTLTAVPTVPMMASSMASIDTAVRIAEDRAGALSWGYGAKNNLWVESTGVFDTARHMKVTGNEGGYKGNLYGVTTGYEHVFRTPAITTGLALTFMKGDYDSDKSIFDYTNDSKTFGATMYAGWEASEHFNIVGTVSYFYSDNDFDMKIPLNFANKATAKDKTQHITGSLRFEFPTKFGKGGLFVPYIGTRYTYTKKGDYNLELDGQTVANGSYKDTNTFQVPIGFGIREDFHFANGWFLSPRLNAEVIGQLGNTKRRIAMTSQFGSSDVEAHFLGNIGYRLTGGIYADRKNFSIGADCAMTGGDKGRLGVTVSLKASVRF